MKTMNSAALTEFQHACQQHFVCYTFALSGLEDHVGKLASIAADHEKNLIVGTGHPDEGHWHASMKIRDIVARSQKDGIFADQIAKAFVTVMYSEWDEYYRQRAAHEIAVSAKAIQCDLMGDLRLVRNCIVHKKSVVTDEHTKLKELEWSVSPGSLRITGEMFSKLVDQINRMVLRVAKNTS